MLALLLAITLTSGGLAGWMAYTRNRPRRPVPLPLPGPPADRAEAVRRIVKHLIRRRVGELVEGEAAVLVGRATGVADVALLVSPLGGLRCVGYHLSVHTADVWGLPLFDDARCVDFELVDTTGAIRVSSTGLELAVTREITRKFVPITELPWLPPSARRRGVHVVELREGVLLADTPVLVCGVPARVPLPTDYRDGASAMQLVATPTFPLVASPDLDLFRPGRRPIDPAEL